MLKTLSGGPLLVLLALSCCLPAQAQPHSPVGRWITIDDETGQQKSIVRVLEEGSALVGRVEEIFPAEGQPPDPLCEKCDGPRKDQPILGMTILWDMEPDGEAWSGGRILDPEKGKTYRCKIWLEDGRLRVRGYWGPFHRTQTWLPAETGP